MAKQASVVVTFESEAHLPEGQKGNTQVGLNLHLSIFALKAKSYLCQV